jgi:hypothetical protein
MRSGSWVLSCFSWFHRNGISSPQPGKAVATGSWWASTATAATTCRETYKFHWISTCSESSIYEYTCAWYVFIYIYMYIIWYNMYLCIYMYVCMYRCIYVYVYVCIYMCVCVCVYICILYIYTHMYIQYLHISEFHMRTRTRILFRWSQLDVDDWFADKIREIHMLRKILSSQCRMCRTSGTSDLLGMGDAQKLKGVWSWWKKIWIS